MPILIEQVEFTDIYGNALPYYQSNVGDPVTAVVSVRSAIRVTSTANSLIFDLTLNTVFSSTQSWIEEGFRVGDWVRIIHYNSAASVISAWYTQVNYVDEFNCDFDTLNNVNFNPGNGEIMVFLVVNNNGVTVARSRDTLDLLLNHVVNNNNGSPESLIDGEVSRAVFEGVGAMVPTDVIAGTLTGNQSGQFFISASIQRNATPADGWLRHQITIEFINSGAYNPAWFTSSNCLKLYLKLLWASVASEPFDRTEAVYTSNANTGYFDQPHNTSAANSTLVATNFTELSYCTINSGLSVTVNGPVSNIGFGLMYIPIDTSYYKNQVDPQQNITIMIPTFEAALGTFLSYQNPTGVQYGVFVTGVSTIGSETTIQFDFGGGSNFTDFMESRNQDDRRLVMWVNCGNTNLTIFDGQLTCEPTTFATLAMKQDYGYLDHSQNVTSILGNKSGFIADTEDDVAYLGTFLLEKNEVFDSFTVKIEAYNDITEEDFTLQQAVFSFSGVQISTDGRYLLAEQATAVTTLPVTSEKRLTILELDPSIDVGTQYGVKIYAPWLLNWKYWIQKNDANVAFYPTQNENWQPYDGSVADWVVRTELILQQGILGYHHANEITIRDYDAEPLIASSIELIRELDSSVVTAIPSGEMMRLKSTHVKNGGTWGPLQTWGMITVEPFEGGPRSICSSVVDYDNNTFNPLTPETGTLISISYPTPNTAVMECLFDTNKIDLSNGVSVTAKIKDPRNGTDPELPENYQERIKVKYEAVKLPETFEEQDRGFEKCCEKVLVFGSPDPETWKSDVTSMWVKLANPSDSFTFVLKKDGVPTTIYTPTPIEFVNEPNAFYATIKWDEVLNLEGRGCYTLVTQYNIGGMTGENIWRNTTYQLEEFSIEAARTTARIRAFFNLEQMIEGINFKESNVEDSIRFHGQIRKEQPNLKQRNVTQNNRRIEPIISEKYQTYTIETDGYTDPMLSLLEDLFLLSANELFISDYNAHTNSYGILDTEVTMTEEDSPEREPDDRFTRQEVLTCVVGNRFRNQRTHY